MENQVKINLGVAESVSKGLKEVARKKRDEVPFVSGYRNAKTTN